jgi:predicted O-methyltransferase YrrM
MSKDVAPDPDDATAEHVLDGRLAALCADGWTLFDEFDRRVRDRHFHSFVAADYEAVLVALRRLATPGARFLEWGSATGVITIMADLLGFEAVGIEIDAGLVRTARELAERHASRAMFVEGSFLPGSYSWRSPVGNAVSRTTVTGSSAYVVMQRAMDEFDVVFGYPWGGEAPMMLDLMRRFGREGALLMLFDVSTGVRVYRDGRDVTTRG